MMERQPVVYIPASRGIGTLCVGVTNDFRRRAWEHRNDEQHTDMAGAIARKKQIKKWDPAWKLELIERTNPQWRDLWDGMP